MFEEIHVLIIFKHQQCSHVRTLHDALLISILLML